MSRSFIARITTHTLSPCISHSPHLGFRICTLIFPYDNYVKLPIPHTSLLYFGDTIIFLILSITILSLSAMCVAATVLYENGGRNVQIE